MPAVKQFARMLLIFWTTLCMCA